MWSLVLGNVLLAGVAVAYVLPPPPPPPDEQWKPQPAAPKCMDDLGCFPITDDFYHALYRPINFNPADRQSINTKFQLYTRKNPTEAVRIRAKDKATLDKSNFDAKKKSKFIVHGWFDNEYFGEWMKQMTSEFMLHGDYNVFVVDWSGGNKLPFTQATANTRVVGAEIAFLLQWLKETKSLKFEDVHLLGHSLGAHASGYAGERLKNLGRITCFDPAEPYFQNMPPSVRIDPTDADFVDVVHTDSKSILLGGLGMSQLVGHVDFFPNDGVSQPGCDITRFKTFITEGLVGGVRNAVACNHHRAMDFVKESINSKSCLQTGYVCDDWKTFLEGKCSDCGPKGDKCAILGDKTAEHYSKFKSNTNQNKFFFKTGGGSPFCLYHYIVTVKMSSSSPKGSGYLDLTFRGKEYDTVKLADGSKLSLEPSQSYRFMVTSSKNLDGPSNLSAYWQQPLLSSIFSRSAIRIDNIEFKPMNGVDEKKRTSDTRRFCGTSVGDIKHKTSTALKSC